MTVPRLFAIALIFCIATAAWFVLGGSVVFRTEDTGAQLEGEVSGLWGQPQTQEVPVFKYTKAAERKGAVGRLDLVGSDISAKFDLDQRQKGLLWYSTYQVDFAGTYRVTNPTTGAVDATMKLAFPTPDGAYDGFAVRVDGKDAPVKYVEGQAVVTFPLRAAQTAEVRTGYRTNGLDEWTYLPSPEGAGVIKDFHLVMDTDFTGYNYPDGAVAPTEKAPIEGGSRLTWSYESLVSGRPIGILMPKPMNPGPLASRITFFAPVSLLFFFAALVLLTATKGVRLHPMHYAFLAAAFFAFHLLFAYLVDRIDINQAFLIASVASVALVVGYLWVVVGRNAALLEIAISQFVFLVLFSYSFFFEGLTGLAVTIGAVLTLAYFMAKTARVDWEQAFARKPRPVPVFDDAAIGFPPPPASPPPAPPLDQPPGGVAAH